MIKEILKLGNPKLYEVSEEIMEADLEHLPEWVADLHDTLMNHRKTYGAGRAVAAPQIGVQKRLLYMYWRNCSSMSMTIWMGYWRQ